MAIDTEAKRAASLHYGRPGTAGTTVPSASSTFFKRGATLGLYANEPAAPGGFLAVWALCRSQIIGGGAR